ncbi:MAG: hypothetical protein HQK83_07575 [Fibrobacteria bacterium]|nr:hypothetical protein [Fibrobacteria bacterium]
MITLRKGVVLFFTLAVIIPATSATLEDIHLVGSIPTVDWVKGQGWVDVYSDGTIHVVYEAKYKSGPSIDNLGEAEVYAPGVTGIWNPKVFLDYQGEPHIVYQTGLGGEASSVWYTTKKDGNWITPEKFTDRSETGQNRAMIPSLAIDSAGNILACSWAVSSNKTTRNAATYRWRSPDGTWSSLKALEGGLNWSTTPKVEEVNGDFYMLYQGSDWHIAGPVKAGGTFSTDGIGVHANDTSLHWTVLNEGANFTVIDADTMVFTSGYRISGGCAVMAGIRMGTNFQIPVQLGTFTSPHRDCESMIHPDVAVDKATGAKIVTAPNSVDSSGLFWVYENDAWTSTQKVYDDEWGMQFSDRIGPNVADLPGRGVILCFRHNDNIYLRKLVTEGKLLEDSTVTGITPVSRTRESLSGLRFIESGNTSFISTLVPTNKNFSVKISDLNGKVIGTYKQMNAQALVAIVKHFPTGLYMFDVKK